MSPGQSSHLPLIPQPTSGGPSDVGDVTQGKGEGEPGMWSGWLHTTLSTDGL